MPRLVSREKMLPGGFTFRQPEVNWESTKWASFDSIVHALIAVRQGNPAMRDKHGWSVDYQTVANEVDTYNAVICEKMGWTAYYTGRPLQEGAQTPPFPLPAPPIPFLRQGGSGPHAAAAKFPAPTAAPRVSGVLSAGVAMIKKLAAGAATLLEWEEAGLPHVEQDKANLRAATCAGCPKNRPEKKLTDYFTVPLADMIKGKMERLAQLDLKTPDDDKLMVCDACYCPLRTKIWMPLDMVLKRVRPEDREELNKAQPRCWILSESDAQS